MKKLTTRPAGKPDKENLKQSKLQVFDIPLELLVMDELNPNEMKEDKFDILVQEIQESGFDEPIIVIPHPRDEGKYLIASGHHRVKAARVAGMADVPAVIKESWDEDKQKIALVKRNIVHGQMNTQKFTKLYTELARKYDPKLLQTMLGFTEKKEFEAVYEGIEKSLTPKQKAVLAKAKEKIKSVDDLSSILHKIFKEQGSEAETGYLVFSFGGKNHHYVQIDDATDSLLTALRDRLDSTGQSMQSFMQKIIADAATEIGAGVKLKAVNKKVVRKRPAGK
jgi:hypothetical protein